MTCSIPVGVVVQRPVICSSFSGYRAPCTVILAAASSMSLRSSGVRSIEKALAQRAVRHQVNSEFLESRYHLLLRSPRPERVFALESSERLDRVCATDGLHSCFGKAEVPDLTLLNQLFYRSGHVFDQHVR